MRHAFLADMGGIHVQTINSEESIPINAEQLYHLVKTAYVDWPICSENSIDDKNKRDGLAR